MSTNSDDQALNGGFGSCSALYERFSHCLSFGGQLRQIHREGIAESCGDLIMDYSKCLRAQSSQDEAKKQELFKASYLYKIRDERPANDIFVLKETPSWD